MGLKRRRAGKPLVAHLALVLLLGVGRHLGAKLAHHRLGSRRRTSRQQVRRARQRPRQVAVLVRFRGSRAVVSHRGLHRCDRGGIVGVVSAGRDRRSRRVCRGETVGVTRASRAARAVDIARCHILAERDHSAAGIKSISECWGGRGLRLTDTSITTQDEKMNVSIFPSIYTPQKASDHEVNLRMRYPTVLVLVHRRSVAKRGVARRREAGHGRGGGIGRSLIERSARHVVRQTHHLRTGVTRSSSSRIVAPGDHRGSGNGNTRVWHRHRWAAHFLLLNMAEANLAGSHGSRVDRGSGMGRSLSGPWVGELRSAVVHVVLIHVIEAHPAVLAVLVLNDHRHGG